MSSRKKPIRRKPLPSFGKDLPPIENAAQARRLVRLALEFSKTNKERRYALTTLLNRAAAAKKPNSKAMRIISRVRSRILLRAKPKPEKKKQALNKRTQTYLNQVEESLQRGDFQKCQKLVHLLVSDTPKKESRIVAAFLESRATLAKAKLLGQESLENRSDFADTIMKFYSAAGELYKIVGWFDKAEEMLNAADILKARFKFDL